MPRMVPSEQADTYREEVMARYSTRTEAINYEIISPIQAGESDTAEYDIDAIADTVLLGYEDGYALREDIDFWAVVQDNAL